MLASGHVIVHPPQSNRDNLMHCGTVPLLTSWPDKNETFGWQVQSLCHCQWRQFHGSRSCIKWSSLPRPAAADTNTSHRFKVDGYGSLHLSYERMKTNLTIRQFGGGCLTAGDWIKSGNGKALSKVCQTCTLSTENVTVKTKREGAFLFIEFQHLKRWTKKFEHMRNVPCVPHPTSHRDECPSAFVWPEIKVQAGDAVLSIISMLQLLAQKPSEHMKSLF